MLRLVIDTNVVLDWLFFQMPMLKRLTDSVDAGRVTVHTHPLLIEEFQRVLAFPQFKAPESVRPIIVEMYRKQSVPQPLDAELLLRNDGLPEGFPRCRDPDDERFLALAWHSKADALVSRDKALLKLKRRVQPFGFGILTVPELLLALTQSESCDLRAGGYR